MSEESEILWGMYQEHTIQGRHHETQRATMTNLIITICAAVLGLFVLNESPKFIHLILSGFLIVLGIFGAVFAAKHYERFSMHMQRARGYRNALETTLPATELSAIKNAADILSREKYPRLFGLRLFWFWISIHAIVALVGVNLAIWVLLQI